MLDYDLSYIESYKFERHPSRLTADWISTYLAYTAASEPVFRFRRWAAISTIAAAVARKVWVPFAEKTLFPNLYTILVAPSGCRKSTALEPARSILNRVKTIDIAPDNITIAALIQYMAAAKKSFIWSSSDNRHCSTTVHGSELLVFTGVKDLDKLATLCDFYDCHDTFVKLTKSAGAERLEGVCLNLVGATTPDLLAALMPDAGIAGGFPSRVLFVYSRDQAVRVSPFSPAAQDERTKFRFQSLLTADLESIESMIGPCELTPPFCEAFASWYESSRVPRYLTAPHFGGYISRRGVHAAKLAMLSSISRSPERKLELIDFLRARAWLHEIEITLPSVYESMGANPIARMEVDVLDHIRQYCRPGETIKIRGIREIFHGSINSAELGLILQELSERGYVRYQPDRGTVTLVSGETSITAALADLDLRSVDEQQRCCSSDVAGSPSPASSARQAAG